MTTFIGRESSYIILSIFIVDFSKTQELEFHFAQTIRQ